MKKLLLAVAFLALSIGASGIAHADLDSFMSNLNVQARADLPGFTAKVSAQFGVPVPRVQDIIRTVEAPADAFMCLQLGQMSGRQPDVVVDTYRQNKGKGWGVIAKELGIKPGSPEFHALKRGEFALTGQPGGGPGVGGGGKGHGKGKGRGRDK